MRHMAWCVVVSLVFAALGRTDAQAIPTTKPAETRSSDGRLEANIALVGSTTAPARFGPGEPVNVRFPVTNISKEPIAIGSRNCSWGNEVYFFEVVTEKGTTIALSEPPRAWAENAPTPKELAPGEAFTVDFDLTKMDGWRPMQGTVLVRGIYRAKNEFKGKPDRAYLQGLWEGRLVTEPVKMSFREAGTGAATKSAVGGDEFEVKGQKAEVKIVVEAERTIFSVTSPTGIGKATIDRKGEKWPKELVVRLHIGGLESLEVSCGDATVSGHVSSSADFSTSLHLRKGGKDGPQLTKDNPYWMEVRAFDASGKAVKGLPPKGGYFEVVVPKALLDEKTKTLTLSWIDFYRG